MARVDDEGHVYVGPLGTTAGGGPAGAPAEVGTQTSESNQPAQQLYVGQYPGATTDEALQYFSRKFDDLFNRTLLLKARVAATADTAKSLGASREALQAELQAGAWVGDVGALQALLDEIAEGIRSSAAEQRQEADRAIEAHLAVREDIVAEAEALSAADPSSQHWKSAQQRMGELFDAWKSEQKTPPRLSKAQEDPYWKRFRAARSSFDKERRAFFAQRDSDHAQIRRAKEDLITEAEEMRHSTDFGPTTKAYHRLMDQWKALGRGARKTDDAQWSRFRAAQDVFFAARDASNAELDAEQQDNRLVKQDILAELEKLMPFTDPDTVRDAYHALLERWDRAGRVPRADVKRLEDSLKRVQDAFREAENAQWSRTDPETVARQSSMLQQLEEAIAGLEEDLAQARDAGDPQAVAAAEEALDARRSWYQMISETG